MTIKQAEANYKRARTIHEKEQEKGLTDGSVRQTRRMYFAVEAMGHAAFVLKSARRDADYKLRHAESRYSFDGKLI